MMEGSLAWGIIRPLLLANLICASYMVSIGSYGIAVFNFGVFLILLKEEK